MRSAISTPRVGREARAAIWARYDTMCALEVGIVYGEGKSLAVALSDDPARASARLHTAARIGTYGASEPLARVSRAGRSADRRTRERVGKRVAKIFNTIE